MKLASYIANGKPAFGVVMDDGVVTMNERLGDRFGTLREAIAGGAIDEMRRAAHGVAPDQKLAGLRWLPTIPNPEKIMCVASTTNRTPPSTVQKRPSCRTSFCASSTRWSPTRVT